jgi:hypothetical protein
VKTASQSTIVPTWIIEEVRYAARREIGIQQLVESGSHTRGVVWCSRGAISSTRALLHYLEPERMPMKERQRTELLLPPSHPPSWAAGLPPIERRTLRRHQPRSSQFNFCVWKTPSMMLRPVKRAGCGGPGSAIQLLWSPATAPSSSAAALHRGAAECMMGESAHHTHGLTALATALVSRPLHRNGGVDRADSLARAADLTCMPRGRPSLFGDVVSSSLNASAPFLHTNQTGSRHECSFFCTSTYPFVQRGTTPGSRRGVDAVASTSRGMCTPPQVPPDESNKHSTPTAPGKVRHSLCCCFPLGGLLVSDAAGCHALLFRACSCTAISLPASIHSTHSPTSPCTMSLHQEATLAACGQVYVGP